MLPDAVLCAINLEIFPPARFEEFMDGEERETVGSENAFPHIQFAIWFLFASSLGLGDGPWKEVARRGELKVLYYCRFLPCCLRRSYTESNIT